MAFDRRNQMALRPEEGMTKLLLSTPSRFTGEYSCDDLLFTHAWPSGPKQAQGNLGLTENPMSRNYFVLALDTPPHDRTKTIVVPNYTPTGDVVAIYLSILFGKRFDNHGRLESNGQFYLPHIDQGMAPCNVSLPFNSHKSRCDLELPLNLSEIQRLTTLLTDEQVEAKFIQFLRSAGRFYLHALQEAEADPEVAFLDLITCGEILSNFWEYEKDDLLDDQLKADLARVSGELEGGEAIAGRIRGRLFQVKRKFIAAILRLLSSTFFEHTEATQPFCALKAEDIETRIKAAYDLRSRYVHTGLDFGNWIFQGSAYLEEIFTGEPVVDDKDFKKLLMRSPTLCGLERIMRFCLLRFIHLNGCTIDARLDGEGMSKQRHRQRRGIARRFALRHSSRVMAHVGLRRDADDSQYITRSRIPSE